MSKMLVRCSSGSSVRGVHAITTDVGRMQKCTKNVQRHSVHATVVEVGKSGTHMRRRLFNVPDERSHRCDVLQETEPPICQHCKQYSFECTFFLPITETRFKKKRQEEEAAAAVAAAAKADEKRAEFEAQDSPMPEGTRGVRIDGKYFQLVICAAESVS